MRRLNTPSIWSAGFRQGLNEAGFIEGQNVVIEFSSAEGHLDRLPALMADLIRRPVAVIVANGSAAKVAKSATKTIPIIFAFGGNQPRGSRYQHQPSGWQRHWRDLPDIHNWREAVRVAA